MLFRMKPGSEARPAASKPIAKAEASEGMVFHEHIGGVAKNW